MKNKIDIEVPEGYQAVWSEDKSELIFKKKESSEESIKYLKRLMSIDLGTLENCGEFLRKRNNQQFSNCAIVTDYTNLITKETMLPIEYATALYTFIKLLTCYKAWWEKYDFKDDECGYSIIAYKVEAKWEEGFGKKPEFLVRFNSSPNNPLFRFSSKCLAEKFIESFKDLLEEAAIFFYV